MGADTASRVTVSYPFNFIVLNPVVKLVVKTVDYWQAALTMQSVAVMRNESLGRLQCVAEFSRSWPSPSSPAAGWRMAPTTSCRTSRSRRSNAPTQPVVVAAADLQLGAELKKEDLTVVNFPAGQAPRGLLLEAVRHHRPRPDRARS